MWNIGALVRLAVAAQDFAKKLIQYPVFPRCQGCNELLISWIIANMASIDSGPLENGSFSCL